MTYNKRCTLYPSEIENVKYKSKDNTLIKYTTMGTVTGYYIWA